MKPHGYPSHMTVGKLLELTGSKAGVLGAASATAQVPVNNYSHKGDINLKHAHKFQDICNQNVQCEIQEMFP